MLDFLRSALRASGVRPSGLIVEMTETSALSDVTKARHFIETLRSMGCRFALDDFGVGYSSFDYLKRLPVDIVKIDGSFVRDLTHSPVSQEIVAAIVRAARGLGLTTVAESVHNEATYDAVRAMDVDLAQGYWLGRPRSTSSIIRDLSFRRAA
jgi:EAL domain-containing protein (putative c-di-GMP-specific phosphodiesterase class I)